MEANRKFWNDQQKLLRVALARPETHARAIELFLSQHAMVHPAALGGQAAVMSEYEESGNNGSPWSFEDEVMDGLTEDQIRCIPPGGEHSLAWTLWHTTRIEDVTMNLLVASSPQTLDREGWFERMKVPFRDTGNTMGVDGVARLSAAVVIPALRGYRLAVARRTVEVVTALIPDEVKRKVDPARIEQIRRHGAVLETASDLLDYWGGLTIAGLLLMPPTRHQFVHWNEALRIKQKII